MSKHGRPHDARGVWDHDDADAAVGLTEWQAAGVLLGWFLTLGLLLWLVP